MSAQLEEFFRLCDPEDRRTVDRRAFHSLCGRFEISERDADVIFDDLDSDQDGLINFEDFSRGFSDFLVVAPSEGDCPSADACKEDETKGPLLTAETQHADDKRSGERSLQWLLQELQSSEKRHLVPFLESAVEELLANLKRLQEEKLHLEELWRREKSEHERHLKRMEEEVDSQVKEAELNVRLQAQAEVEDERKTLQSKMDAEMDNLQVHLALFEKVNSWLQRHPQDNHESRLDEVKAKLDEAVGENRRLRMSLLDTQTNIALMHSELMQLRTLYEEKCRELSSEREKILEVLHEQDHLSRQLNLLHDANRRLQDTNDVLRSSLDQPIKPPRMLESQASKGRNGSVMGDYFETGYNPVTMYNFPDKEGTDNEDEDKFYLKMNPLRKARSMDIASFSCQKRSSERRTGRRHFNTPSRESQEHDEGFSSTPDSSLAVREDGCSEDHQKPPHSDPSSRFGGSKESGLGRNELQHAVPYRVRPDGRLSQSTCNVSSIASGEMPRKRISDIIKQLGLQDSPVSFRARSATTGTGSSQEGDSICGSPLRKDVRAKLDLAESGEEPEYAATGPAERSFKVIFVGDAGVGKSSFAHRISRGVFMRYTNSTLGVDFLNRLMRVDGQNVEVQLWDTAGQEKFRCLTKSYFRNADGVMLLYDCTCETSFLNVRRWAEDVDVSCFYSLMAQDYADIKTSMTSQKIPMMIVANKIDLRAKAAHRCVSAEDGQRLAKECDAIFIEASAKNGTNVLHALARLVRCMSGQKELQSSTSVMQLGEEKPRKKACCNR